MTCLLCSVHCHLTPYNLATLRLTGALQGPEGKGTLSFEVNKCCLAFPSVVPVLISEEEHIHMGSNWLCSVQPHCHQPRAALNLSP